MPQLHLKLNQQNPASTVKKIRLEEFRMRLRHKNFIPHMIENKSWITKSGKEILIKDMEDDHIDNVLRIINNQKEYIEIAYMMMNELDHRESKAKKEYEQYEQSLEPTTYELKIEIRDLQERVQQLENTINLIEAKEELA